MRHNYIPLTALSVLAATGAEAKQVGATKQPNVVIIYIDDMGYSDLSCYGESRWKSPNIDAMAENGARFTDFYSASSVSSPSRAALLTGRYPARMGICGVFFPESFVGMPTDEITIAEMLREESYKTAIVGKWHLGHRERYLPLQQGFDSYFGIPYSNDMSGQVYFRDNEVEQFNIDQSQTIKLYTREAINFIEKSSEENSPFFLYLAHSMMHTPLYASEEFRGKSGAGLYGDVVMEVDHSVGQIIKTLRSKGLEEDTLVILTSDNGPWLQEGPHSGTAHPFREGKATDYEGGHRVPFIAYWKDTIKPIEITSLACMLDIFPTLATLCGGEVPNDRPLDGYDISKVMLGEGERENQDFAYMGNHRSVTAFRSGDWKILLPANGITGNFWRPSTVARDTPVLINLKEDIGETTNLYYKYPKKAKEMMKKLEDYQKSLGEFAEPMVMAGNHQLKMHHKVRTELVKEAQKRGVKSQKETKLDFIIAK